MIILITPWAGISIPSDASGFTFNANWDLDNLISRYCLNEATTCSADSNCKDCVFILADNFWERFSMTVDVD